MKEIKLLIIDDDNEVIENFQRSVERFNRDNTDFRLKVYAKSSLDDAESILTYNKLDTAIVDLNLKESEEEGSIDNSDGNQIISKIIKNFRIPIFILTGEPAKLNEDYRDKKNIKLYSKGDKTYPELLTEIKEYISSKTIDYFSRDGFLEEKINTFYWENLQETIDSWNGVAETYPDEINKILSRHTVACLNEQLYVNGNIGKFDQYHHGEMYIIPPIKVHYHTGDILKKDNELFIILNPACDVVNKNKLEYYLLVKIIKIEDIYEIKSKNEVGKETYYNSNLRKGNKVDRYHYLPKFSKIDSEYVIDFQKVQVVDIGENTNSGSATYIKERESNLEADYEQLASISSPFLKDIIARFSLYYARQGQPNFLN